MKRTTRAVAVLTAALAVVGLAACGDDDGTSDAGRGGEVTGTVKVAYLVPDYGGAGAVFGDDAAVGEANVAPAEREFKALIEEVNEKGGVNGRRIEARGYKFPIEEQADESKLAERCIEITEDFGAQYVIDTHIMGFPSAQECFAQHGTVLVGPGFGVSEAFVEDLAPHFVTTDPTIEKSFGALVPKLREVGYLDGAKVGLFLDDTGQVEAAAKTILRPALAEAGARPVAEAKAAVTDQAGLQSAVLRFKDAAVTHVVFVGNVGHFAGFSAAAEASGYRPRYAFPDYFTVASSAATLASQDQLDKAVSVSSCTYLSCVVDDASRSSTDVTSPIDRKAVSPGYRRCLDTLSRVRGVDYYRPADAGASESVVWICNNFLLWRDAAEQSDGLEPARFAKGLRSLGRYPSSRVYATDFGDGSLAGATHFAAGVYDKTCRCYVRATDWTEP